eukprot:XP_014025869.1 PREDICTED: fatty acid desaturase 2-like [Salmo salar]
MGGGGQQTESSEPAKGGVVGPGGGRGGRGGSAVYTWEEVQRHCHRGDQWLVIDRKVYNITQWAKRHPGGIRVISHFAGEDATDAFSAFHPDPNFVRKFLKPLLIGELAPTEPSQDQGKNVRRYQSLSPVKDLAWSMSFYLRFFCCYYPFFGFFGSVALISFVRFLESHWFVWVTQMNHLPMEMDHERHQDWLTMQLSATCNIEQSTFNDWFSGHLNFQIEHHLFPTMPRHNYHLVAPLVRALCEKHGVPYQVKTMQQGLTDVVRSLKKSGDLWLDAYLHK